MATKKKAGADKQPALKTIKAQISVEIDRQIDELVEQGWFPSRQHIIELALRKFLSSHRPELLERFIREDIEWGLRGATLEPPVVDLGDANAYANAGPVRKLIYLVLLLSLKDKASEIRFEPERERYKLSYVVDKAVHDLAPPPLLMAARIGNAIKVMADLDITKRRVPQNGGVRLLVDGSSAEVLVSIQPTEFGERATLNITATAEASQRAARVLRERAGNAEDDNVLLEFEVEENGL
jgi:type II secretory ATPase GspE/PulE/Tfp pilus assembly ATPase PilB-like protein